MIGVSRADVHELLKKGIVMADGAMGTYYAKLSGDSHRPPEWANLRDPHLIRDIHRQYVQAGAQLVRTNTFSANTITLDCTRDELAEIVARGFQLAVEGVGEQALIAADIGPLPEFTAEHAEVCLERMHNEYVCIIDAFLEQGATVFVFETLSDARTLEAIWRYIKEQAPDSFILAQFAVTAEGATRKGLSVDRLLAELQGQQCLDAFGFNCGVGPAHLLRLLRQHDLSSFTVSALPNAGYPEIVHERTIFHENPQYFGELMADLAGLGVKILGGCCGTTPAHIRALTEALQTSGAAARPARQRQVRRSVQHEVVPNHFAAKLRRGEFPVAVELDPPFNSDVEAILRAARVLKDAGVDIITIADSPLARARMDSLVLAGIIRREVGMDVMPHLCCRDRNGIALKSSLLAAHAQGIRSILAVTGDPVPSGERGETKAVFNLNSIRLMELIAHMNSDVFAHDPLVVGGALNMLVPNVDACLERTRRKQEQGARFVLSQPVFSDEAMANLELVRRHCQIPVLGGIMPLVSRRNAQFLNNEVPGIQVPEALVQRFTSQMEREEAAGIGAAIATDLIGRMRPNVDGLYIIAPFNRAQLVVGLMRRCELGAFQRPALGTYPLHRG